MKILLNIIYLLLPSISFSQPGGGGGLFIKYFYNQLGEEINIEHNQDYTLECFLLNDTLLATKNIYTKLENNFKNFQVDSIGYYPDYRDSTKLLKGNFRPIYKYKGIWLKPINSGGWNDYDNYRIVVSKLSDTMVIDFVKVIGENSYGLNSKIESLTFYPGYFQHKKEDIYTISQPHDTLWIINSLNLNSYSPLITSKKKYLKEFELIRVNIEIKELDNQIIVLKKSEEWKRYDESNKKHTLDEFEKQKKEWIRYRKELISDKRLFERQILNSP